jgi:hypothetical protein
MDSSREAFRQDLRSCIHIARRAAGGNGGPIVADSSATIGIRVMPSGQLLDCTPGFKEPSRCIQSDVEERSGVLKSAFRKFCKGLASGLHIFNKGGQLMHGLAATS